MKVVVVGKGGREHALARKIQESPLLTRLWVCPGNPGMTRAGLDCAPFESADAVERFCLEQQADLVVIGPEALILTDLKTRLAERGIPVFAPSKEAAQMEASKLFCKEILNKAQVPTAKCVVVKNAVEALKEVRAHDYATPMVVKADGLAAGKGVAVCKNLQSTEEAIAALGDQYGYPMLLEECLIGKELSAFALCDGKDFVVLGTACDYKRITPDPFSANTGGMGAYSPCDFITAEDEASIRQIFARTLNYLSDQGLPYQGFLFAGLMKTAKGIYVIEYNVRMGDPETQALMPRLKTDLLQLISAAVKHDLRGQSCELSEQTSVHVVAVSEGYPGNQLNLGHPIEYPTQTRSQLYFAGVGQKGENLTNTGGRVLGMTALAATKEQARQLAYADLRQVKYQGMYFREDIAQ